MRLYGMLHVFAVIIGVAICLSFVKTTTAGVQKTLHVSPGGNDEGPGTKENPFRAIKRARDEVRKINQKMSGDIEVILHDGTYRLGDTLVFDRRDGGTGGHKVIYKAAQGAVPIVSGGKDVTGWTPDAKGRWKAKTDIDNFRQLYIDGRRAVRARGDVPADMALHGTEGYKTSDLAMADWKNPGDIEFCYQVVWAHTRCKVQDIRRQGDRAVVTMLQPHFTHAREKEGVHIELPKYIENVFELLDEPGEWYLDRASDTVYYIPKPGEDMTKTKVVAPAVECLVELRGTLDAPVENMEFAGITFAEGGWLRPSRIGLVDVQANFVIDWKRPMKRAGGYTVVHNEHVKSPANVVCRTAKNVKFERCTFTRLGSAGIDMEFGSQNNSISGCRFNDISGTAVQIGDLTRNDHHPDDPRMIVKNNSVTNNHIHNCCVEYMGGVGVFVGYTDGTKVAHNEIHDLPYSGMSIGWGWGEEDAGGGAENYYMPYRYATPTPSGNNRIENNHIYRVM
ncbi:MAG: right-handed parallel beta-helix repeat-containing protein, partial [Pirellulales bacterium]|nr:right-handed parallel beta-helix repeat-containing protein [Pirellulales bacterium]